MKNRTRYQKGTTLVELVTVILLLGIIAAIAAPRFFGRNTFDERGYFETVLSSVRYAQKLAIASGCDIRVNIDATGVQLDQWNDDIGIPCTAGDAVLKDVLRPGSNNAFDESPPNGVAIAGAALFYFDAIGRPRDVATENLLAVPTSVVIGGRTLTIENETGFVRCTAGCS